MCKGNIEVNLFESIRIILIVIFLLVGFIFFVIWMVMEFNERNNQLKPSDYQDVIKKAKND